VRALLLREIRVDVHRVKNARKDATAATGKALRAIEERYATAGEFIYARQLYAAPLHATNRYGAARRQCYALRRAVMLRCDTAWIRVSLRGGRARRRSHVPATIVVIRNAKRRRVIHVARGVASAFTSGTRRASL